MADPVADLSSLENLPDKCNQPRRFSFPQREFGKQSKVKRSFQPSWFDRWTWLHYRADNDSVVCFTCQLDLLEIGNEFVGFSEHRLTMFGKFCSTDSDKTS